jgi:hypothetical protein
LAGTAKQYSKNAIPQDAGISAQSAVLGYLSCPYQANVVKTLEMLSSRMGAIKGQNLTRKCNTAEPPGAAITGA